ncbi:AraC family transcriptional regulator [Mucilaginibacter daejeonensis]|uniref:helix-turn-helix domain-containing protein n=1 Tax=Mucilaginibacter daejeonensis TaxID=398049 RepID=UPI001D175ABD|nr:AraC family transcriptional regulator [Mucilaginibacter daejeonensis]UEG51886.1 AraC family transcriptional regulator [Mucilaginibacter daejeonensis]
MQQPISKIIEERFVYSCTFQKQRGYEQFVPECLLAYQVSGETEVQHRDGTLLLKPGQLLLARRNQFTKSIKLPGNNEPYKVISVIFPVQVLQQYAAEKHYIKRDKYNGPPNLILEPDGFLKSYFNSLLPYLEQAEQIDKPLGLLKTTEALHILLKQYPELTDFLFDFTAPYKMELEKFMNENYHYNVPVDIFARMTGRSLAGFKRDFKSVFKESPRKWLLEKRLSKACSLIIKGAKKPSEIYLELGFENLSHFYKAFKHKYGVTPTNYKINDHD